MADMQFTGGAVPSQNAFFCLFHISQNSLYRNFWCIVNIYDRTIPETKRKQRNSTIKKYLFKNYKVK